MPSKKTRSAIAERFERALVEERDKNDILRNALNEIMTHASHDTDGRFYYLTAQKALKEASDYRPYPPAVLEKDK